MLTSYILTAQAAYIATRTRGVTRQTGVPANRLPDGFRSKVLRLAAEGKASVMVIRG